MQVITTQLSTQHLTLSTQLIPLSLTRKTEHLAQYLAFSTLYVAVVCSSWFPSLQSGSQFWSPRFSTRGLQRESRLSSLHQESRFSYPKTGRQLTHLQFSTNIKYCLEKKLNLKLGFSQPNMSSHNLIYLQLFTTTHILFLITNIHKFSNATFFNGQHLVDLSSFRHEIININFTILSCGFEFKYFCKIFFFIWHCFSYSPFLLFHYQKYYLYCHKL